MISPVEPPVSSPSRGGVAEAVLAGSLLLGLLVGTVAGTIWLVARLEAERVAGGDLSARGKLVPSTAHSAPVSRPSLEEILERVTPPSDDHLPVLREGEQKHVRQATQAMDAGLRRHALQAWMKVGEIRGRLRLWRSAAGAYRYAVQAAQELLEDQEADLELQVQLVRCTLLTAQSLHRAGQLAEAEQYAQQAADLGQEGTEQFATTPDFPEQVARAQALLAEIARNQQRDSAAEEHAQAALTLWLRLLRQHTTHPSGHLECGRLLVAQGTYHHRHGRAAHARDCFQAAVTLLQTPRPAPLVPEQHLLLGIAYLRQGKIAAALQALHTLGEADGVDLLFGTACLQSQASRAAELAAPERERLTQSALRLLRRVEQADGFRDAEDYRRLRDEPDLAPLRAVDEFQQLLQDAQRRVRPRPLLET